MAPKLLPSLTNNAERTLAELLLYKLRVEVNIFWRRFHKSFGASGYIGLAGKGPSLIIGAKA
jgi:hypothetical protein